MSVLPQGSVSANTCIGLPCQMMSLVSSNALLNLRLSLSQVFKVLRWRMGCSKLPTQCCSTRGVRGLSACARAATQGTCGIVVTDTFAH